MWGLSYWIFPTISGLSWLGMLMGLLIHWTTTGRPHYQSMNDGQTIAFISDVGAFELKPLFITASAITTILVDISLLSERFLRHRGRLVSNYTVTEKRLSIASIVCGVIGGMGLVFLTIFDTNNYSTVHNIFLFVFMGGYIASAICSCWEYQSMGMKGREHRVLRNSFWIKLVFIIVQVVLAIAFVATLFSSAYNAAAVLEWTLAFCFGIFIFSYVVDLVPAVKSDRSSEEVDVESKETEEQ